MGFSIASLIGFFGLYLWPEVITPYLSRQATHKSDNFIVHYSKEAPFKDKIKEFVSNQEKLFEQLLDFLKLDRDLIPEKIHLYLYENIQSLKSGISSRKSSPQASPLALLDLIWGQDTSDSLTLLIVDFGLGPASSELLRKGVQVYFEKMDRHLHTEAAALSENQFLSIKKLLKLEEVGLFPKGFSQIVYEHFDSPRAKAALGLGSLRTLLKIDKEKVGIYFLPTSIESGSMVKFLIQKWGMDKFKKIWGSDTLIHGVEVTYGLSLEELEDRWRDHFTNKGKGDPLYEYFRGTNLLKAGKYEMARVLLKESLSSPNPEVANRARYQLGILNFYNGKWALSRSFFSRVETELFSKRETLFMNRYLDLSNFYEKGSKEKTEDLLVILPPGKQDGRLALKGQEILDKALRTFKLKREKLPDQLIASIKPTDNSNHNFSELTLPQGFLHINPEITDPGYTIIKFLSNYISESPTYSNLLKEGLAYYLGNPERDYFKKASEILKRGNWIPLEELIFGSFGTEKVNTEAAALVGYLLTQYDTEKFAKIWLLTSPFGGNYSLMTAIRQVYGVHFNDLIRKFYQFLQVSTKEKKESP